MYLLQVKSARRTGGDTYTILLNKLEKLFKFYLETQKIDIFDALVDVVVKLQFLKSLDPTLGSFVEIRDSNHGNLFKSTAGGKMDENPLRETYTSGRGDELATEGGEEVGASDSLTQSDRLL